MAEQKKKSRVLSKVIPIRCWADCHGPVETHPVETMSQACGEPDGRIIRGDTRFHSLYQMIGDYILFSSEESVSSTWCGQPGRKCVSCDLNASGDEEPCADRMMTSQLASKLTRLAKLAAAEWPERKIVVREAWDEPTSEFPEGQHGNISVFYEGRAAQLKITRPNSTSKTNILYETDEHILRRLSELAVCSAFAMVSKDDSDQTLELCVKKPGPETFTNATLRYRTIMLKVGYALSAVKGSLSMPTGLNVGSSHPDGVSFESVCGLPTGKISQENQAWIERLIQYPLDDVMFASNEQAETWCGVETRSCRSCNDAITDDPWYWCDLRSMTVRLATKLRRLSVLMEGSVEVVRAHTTRPLGSISPLYSEGRAATLRVPKENSATVTELSSWAIVAGFDYVFLGPDFLEVCVKPQDGIESQIVDFPRSQLLSVPIPFGESDEYEYPVLFANEGRKPLLFDSTIDSIDISPHFKKHMFLSPGVRYFRLDPVLIEVLELAIADLAFGLSIVPGSGYRPRSVNLNNIQTRHLKEIYRYEMGQAVEIQPNGKITDESLYRTGIALMRAGRSVQQRNFGIGIGAKRDRLYFDIRPLSVGDQHLAVDVWDSGNSALYQKFHIIQSQISAGGTIVTAKFDDHNCKESVLGKNFYYFTFELDEEGYCWAPDSEFCDETLELRQNISVKFQRTLTAAAGAESLPKPDIMPEIEQCIVHLCGGCPDAGDVWKKKVVYCSQMILKYLQKKSTPFPPLKDKVAIFNTENSNSRVHAQACREGLICVENTQIYSLLMPLITATYERENTPDLVFGGADNPNPVLDIVKQELAWRARGKVNVFIDDSKDILALRSSLKILMVLNKEVTEVVFHVDPEVDRTNVDTSLRRKIEEWSLSVCPLWSRTVVTPYKILTIDHERKRRNTEISEDRNRVKESSNRWEIDWILQN